MNEQELKNLARLILDGYSDQPAFSIDDSFIKATEFKSTAEYFIFTAIVYTLRRALPNTPAGVTQKVNVAGGKGAWALEDDNGIVPELIFQGKEEADEMGRRPIWAGEVKKPIPVVIFRRAE